MPIISEQDLDPVGQTQVPSGPKIVTPDQLDPVMDITSASLGQFNPNMQMPTQDQISQDLQKVPGEVSQFGRGLVENLPTAGMIAGGAIAGGAGGPLGPFTAPVGAGLGGAIGAGARGALKGYLGLGETPPVLPALGEMGKEGAMATTAEVGGPYMAKGIQKITSPFATMFENRIATDAVAREAQSLVENQGARISPDVINPSKTANFFTWLTDKIFPANTVMARQRGNLPEIATALKDEFVASRGLYDVSKGKTGSVWDEWVNLAGGPEAPYAMPKTEQVLNQVMGQPATSFETGETIRKGGKAYTQMGTFWKKQVATFQDELDANGQVNVQAIRDLFNSINPAAAKGAERTARMKIADAVMEDLSNTGNTEMVDTLQAARNLSRMNRVASPLRDIFNKSMTPNPRTGDLEFNPDTFSNLWQQRRTYFLDNKNYSAEDIRTIDQFNNKMSALVPDLSRLKSYNPTLNQLNFQNPAPVLGAVYAKPILAVPLGADVGLAYSLMNPNGIMRRFLTTGFNPPVLSSKMGIMKGMEAAND